MPKYVIVVPDGAADEPIESLGGQTPLEAAQTPNMDRISRQGRLGLVRTVPDGLEPGSDVAQMSLLGYDPLPSSGAPSRRRPATCGSDGTTGSSAAIS
jgi:2,3-bisphosphoglycerate-independent phosphoglycerate mutase